jgi:hypothetical protein
MRFVVVFECVFCILVVVCDVKVLDRRRRDDDGGGLVFITVVLSSPLSSYSGGGRSGENHRVGKVTGTHFCVQLRRRKCEEQACYE